MNRTYPTAKEIIIGWDRDESWPAGLTLNLVAVGLGYTYDSAHDTLADLDSDDIIIPEIQLVNPVYANYTINANDVSESDLAEGLRFAGFIVYYKWTGDGGGSLLICYINEFCLHLSPVTLSGGLLEITWDDRGICHI